MHVQFKRRTDEDRRAFAVYYRYGHERLNNTGNRRLDTVEELRPYFTGNLSSGRGDASPGAAETVREIAEAFGVAPESLELVESDDLVDGSEICRSCEDRRKGSRDLAAALAESEKNLELFRQQVHGLLLSSDSSRRS
jgi:hypothetical protein